MDRVLNVHIETDVLNGVKDPPIPAGKVAIGYTKSQVRQALGGPTTVVANGDKTSTFTFGPGPIESVTFN